MNRLRRTLTLLGALAAASAAALANEPARLRVGVPDGMPGYTALAEGQMRLEDPVRSRVVACIERQLNLRFVWQPLPTRRVLQGLRTGALDLAFPMGFTPERERSLLPSLPTWDNPDVWLSLRPVDPQDRQLRVAARLGSPQHEEHAADGYRHVKGYLSYSDLPRALTRGLADAAVVPRTFFEQHPGLWPAGTQATPGRSRRSGFYLPAGDPRGLLAPLNRAIEACREATPAAAASRG